MCCTAPGRSQVLRWMAAPVPADQYQLACPTPSDMSFPGGRFCPPPAGGCVQGSWDAAACACACQDENNATLPGFCPSKDTGQCLMVKVFDPATQTFSCPEGSAPSAGPPAAAEQAWGLANNTGHPHSLAFTGLSISAPGLDASSAWALAYQAVDSDTRTCAAIDAAASGQAYLTVHLVSG